MSAQSNFPAFRGTKALCPERDEHASNKSADEITEANKKQALSDSIGGERRTQTQCFRSNKEPNKTKGEQCHATQPNQEETLEQCHLSSRGGSSDVAGGKCWNMNPGAFQCACGRPYQPAWTVPRLLHKRISHTRSLVTDAAVHQRLFLPTYSGSLAACGFREAVRLRRLFGRQIQKVIR